MKHGFKYGMGMLLCLLGTVRAEVELATVFTRSMVFQREAAHPVFGRATPGNTVRVEFAGQTCTTTADAAGRWKVVLDPMEANDQEQPLTVSSEGKQVRLTDLLIGDVWICAGDALMAQGAGGFDAGSVEGDPLIRQYAGRSVGFHMPQADFIIPSLVKRGIPKDLKSQNLIAYGFAREIRQVSGVPVYMFNVASGKHGGMANWASPQSHRFLTDLHADLKRDLNAVDPLSPEGRAAYMRTREALEHWVTESDARVSRVLYPRPAPVFPNEGRGLSAAYNAYLHPLRTLPVKGILWFTMIRDNASPAERGERLSALFQSWRQAFNRPDLPIYTAQLYDPFAINPRRPGGVTLGEIRAVFSVLGMDNVGVGVSHDLNKIGDFRLPPEGEVELGRRMALWAAHQVYGRDLAFSGPLYRRHLIQENTFLIDFEHGEGLRASDGDEIHGFFVAGEDTGFKPARAVVQGGHLKVWSDEVAEPTRLTYATSNATPRPNLVNAAGLPAAAFVTGDRP